MTDYTYMSAAELAPKLELGEVSSVEVTQQYLDRIQELDSNLYNYITVTPEKALEMARKADEEIKAGNYRGKLHGIPVGIKDTYKTEGVISTSGSALFKDYVPEETSSAVDNIFESGAVMLGKLNMHSLGPGSAGINPTFGTTRNPFNTNYICGGSSSGSGSALASGLAMITTGTDMWGSLRVPAAMTGVYGFKPTQGLVSSAANIPTSESLDQTGPMGRTPEDVAILLQAMAGYDPKDPKSHDVEIPNYTKELDKGIDGLKIGVPTYYRQGLDKEVEENFDKAISKLEELGASVEEFEMPELDMTFFAGQVTALTESAANYYTSLKEQPEVHAQDVRSFLLAGTLLNGTQYIRAQKIRRIMAQAFAKAFEKYDVILGPTIPIKTPAFDEENWASQAIEVVEKVKPFTVPANLTGLPAISVPMGLDQDGLPTGMQFFGPNFSEHKLLQVANAWDTTNPTDFDKVQI